MKILKVATKSSRSSHEFHIISVKLKYTGYERITPGNKWILKFYFNLHTTGLGGFKHARAELRVV